MDNKYGENLGKYRRGIIEKLGKNWVGNYVKLVGNVGQISGGIGTEI